MWNVERAKIKNRGIEESRGREAGKVVQRLHIPHLEEERDINPCYY